MIFVGDAEDALQTAWRDGYYLSWACMDSGQQFQVNLRRRDELPVSRNARTSVFVLRGRGRTIGAAVHAAMDFESVVPDAAPDVAGKTIDYEDLLG